jgi:hypothetical protein
MNLRLPSQVHSGRPKTTPQSGTSRLVGDDSPSRLLDVAAGHHCCVEDIYSYMALNGASILILACLLQLTGDVPAWQYWLPQPLAGCSCGALLACEDIQI